MEAESGGGPGAGAAVAGSATSNFQDAQLARTYYAEGSSPASTAGAEHRRRCRNASFKANCLRHRLGSRTVHHRRVSIARYSPGDKRASHPVPT